MARTQRKARSLERSLVTGNKLDAAANDPAGSARALGARSKARSSAVVQRNIDVGLMTMDAADGGLGHILETLDRLSELAIAASSDTLNDADRLALGTEASEALQTIESIARGTRFGSDRLLTTHKVDVGFMIDTSASMGGELAQLQSGIGAFRQRFEDANLDVQFGLSKVFTPADPSDGVVKLSDIAQDNFMDQLMSVQLGFGAVDPYSAFHHGVNADGDSPDAFTWRQQAAERHIIYITDTRREADLLPGDETQGTIASSAREARVALHVIADDRHHDTFSGLTGASGGTLYDKGNGAGDRIQAALGNIADGITSGFGSTSVEFQVGPDSGDRFKTGLPVDSTLDALALTQMSLDDPQAALEAVDMLQTARDEVVALRARIGAGSSRLRAMRENEAQRAQALAQSRSRMEDVDVARATAELTRQRVVEEASIGMVQRLHSLQSDVLGRLLNF